MKLQVASPATHRGWSPTSAARPQRGLQLGVLATLSLLGASALALAALALWHSVDALRDLLHASASPAPLDAPAPVQAAQTSAAPAAPVAPASVASAPVAAAPLKAEGGATNAVAASAGRPPTPPAASTTSLASWDDHELVDRRYDGATCEGVFVYAVMLVEGLPLQSAVSLGTSAAGPSELARPGQTVSGWEVLAITDDWTGMDPVVWLGHEDRVCRARLTGNPARLKAIEAQARREQAARRAAQRREQARRRAARRKRR